MSVNQELLAAVVTGDKTPVNDLIKKGANINFQNETGATPLYVAAQNGRSSIVNLLLERNAMVNQPAKDGTTPLAIAAKVGAGECAEALLSYGANVNHPNKAGWTALHNAAIGGHTWIVRTLLKEGANAVAQTTEGKTALDLATENNHDDCVSLLQYATDKAGHAPTSTNKKTTSSMSALDKSLAELSVSFGSAGANAAAAKEAEYVGLFSAFLKNIKGLFPSFTTAAQASTYQTSPQLAYAPTDAAMHVSQYLYQAKDASMEIVMKHTEFQAFLKSATDLAKQNAQHQFRCPLDLALVLSSNAIQQVYNKDKSMESLEFLVDNADIIRAATVPWALVSNIGFSKSLVTVQNPPASPTGGPSTFDFDSAVQADGTPLNLLYVLCTTDLFKPGWLLETNILQDLLKHATDKEVQKTYKLDDNAISLVLRLLGLTIERLILSFSTQGNENTNSTNEMAGSTISLPKNKGQKSPKAEVEPELLALALKYAGTNNNLSGAFAGLQYLLGLMRLDYEPVVRAELLNSQGMSIDIGQYKLPIINQILQHEAKSLALLTSVKQTCNAPQRKQETFDYLTTVGNWLAMVADCIDKPAVNEQAVRTVLENWLPLAMDIVSNAYAQTSLPCISSSFTRFITGVARVDSAAHIKWLVQSKGVTTQLTARHVNVEKEIAAKKQATKNLSREETYKKNRQLDVLLVARACLGECIDAFMQSPHYTGVMPESKSSENLKSPTAGAPPLVIPGSDEDAAIKKHREQYAKLRSGSIDTDLNKLASEDSPSSPRSPVSKDPLTSFLQASSSSGASEVDKLHAVIRLNDLNTVKSMVSTGGVAILNAKTRPTNRTALHIAALEDVQDIYEYLITTGVDEKVKDSQGKTAKEYLRTRQLTPSPSPSPAKTSASTPQASPVKPATAAAAAPAPTPEKAPSPAPATIGASPPLNGTALPAVEPVSGQVLLPLPYNRAKYEEYVQQNKALFEAAKAPIDKKLSYYEGRETPPPGFVMPEVPKYGTLTKEAKKLIAESTGASALLTAMKQPIEDWYTFRRKSVAKVQVYLDDPELRPYFDVFQEFLNGTYIAAIAVLAVHSGLKKDISQMIIYGNHHLAEAASSVPIASVANGVLAAAIEHFGEKNLRDRMQNALIFPTPIEVYSLFETIAIRATESRKEELRYGKRSHIWTPKLLSKIKPKLLTNPTAEAAQLRAVQDVEKALTVIFEGGLKNVKKDIVENLLYDSMKFDGIIRTGTLPRSSGGRFAAAAAAAAAAANTEKAGTLGRAGTSSWATKPEDDNGKRVFKLAKGNTTVEVGLFNYDVTKNNGKEPAFTDVRAFLSVDLQTAGKLDATTKYTFAYVDNTNVSTLINFEAERIPAETKFIQILASS